jgi:hypothetical protein
VAISGEIVKAEPFSCAAREESIVRLSPENSAVFRGDLPIGGLTSQAPYQTHLIVDMAGECLPHKQDEFACPEFAQDSTLDIGVAA